MKKKYLIGLDMDGTLLNTQKQISSDTLAYLHKLDYEGYPLILCSGRPARAMIPYYRELGIKTWMICYNGSLILNPSSERIYQKKMISGAIINEIIDQIGEENFENILCENDTDCYMLRRNEALFGFFWQEGMQLHFGHFEKIKDQFIMIIQMANHDFDDKLVKLCFSYPGLGIRFWEKEGLTSELYFLDTDKGTALSKVASFYHIPEQDIIAFGDAGNDIPMFDVVGKPILMKNSHVELADGTEYMISHEDNDHDGIKKTLEYLLATNK